MEGHFRKLNVAETSKMLEEIHRKRSALSFKFKDSPVFRAKAGTRGWGKSVLCTRPANLTDDRRSGAVTVQFTLDNEIYFFEGKVQANRRLLFLHLSSGIFQLIRRKVQRVPVPPNFPLFFMTKRIGERLIFVKGVIQDISAKGCRVALNTATPVVKVDDVIVGYLRINERKGPALAGKVRHRKSLKTGPYDQVFGVEFTLMVDKDSRALEKLMIDLRMEFFRSQME